MAHRKGMGVIEQKLVYEVVREITDIVPPHAVANEAELLKMAATSHLLFAERTEDFPQIRVERFGEGSTQAMSVVAHC